MNVADGHKTETSSEGLCGRLRPSDMPERERECPVLSRQCGKLANTFKIASKWKTPLDLVNVYLGKTITHSKPGPTMVAQPYVTSGCQGLLDVFLNHRNRKSE